MVVDKAAVRFQNGNHCELESIQKSTIYLPTFQQFHTSEINYQIADWEVPICSLVWRTRNCFFFPCNILHKTWFAEERSPKPMYRECCEITLHIIIVHRHRNLHIFLNFDFADEIAHRTKLASLF